MLDSHVSENQTSKAFGTTPWDQIPRWSESQCNKSLGIFYGNIPTWNPSKVIGIWYQIDLGRHSQDVLGCGTAVQLPLPSSGFCRCLPAWACWLFWYPLARWKTAVDYQVFDTLLEKMSNMYSFQKHCMLLKKHDSCKICCINILIYIYQVSFKKMQYSSWKNHCAFKSEVYFNNV